MNKSILLKTYVASALLCLTLFASCSADDDDTALPEGKYPMTFATAMEGLTQTRATTDNTWTGNEKIAVQVGGEVKEYKPTASGAEATLTGVDAANTFYWQHAGETKEVSAWYCGDGSTAANQTNARQLPAAWTVKTAQSGNGYAESDFLYAMPQDISFSGRNSTKLSFYHQTARVVINICNAEAATSATEIVSVSIVNTYTTANYTPPTTGSTAGTWSEHKAPQEITPKDITTPTGVYLKSYAALVLPQEMSNRQFIAVKLNNGNTYYYTPKTNEANLESGKQYDYEITVKHGYLDVVENVDAVWGGSGATEEVESKTPKEGFSASDLKIGDYYYSDGTYSDGGYREYTDGNTAHLDIYPVLTGGRTVIGIVMKVGRDENDDCEYKFKDNSTTMDDVRGYVLALHDANNGSNCQWGPNESVGTNTEENTGFYGYFNTQTIIEYVKKNSMDLQTDFPATYHAKEGYENKHPAPNNSSGWFLPSAGQCLYWVKNKEKLLPQVKKATGDDSYNWKSNYWSSSESSSDPTRDAWYVGFYGGRVYSVRKYGSNYVRSCLAF